MTEHHAERAAEGPYDPELREAGQLSSPTWELELFLSGAFVFSSFQLPGVIEAVFRRLEPHVNEASSVVLFDATLYAKAIAFTLIATFLVHLVARAYWVALLGLNSVFPSGIRWDEMKVGPVSRDVYRETVPALGVSIERLDNFCSVVFSAGLLIAVMFVYSTLLAGTVAGSAYLLSETVGRGHHFMMFLLGIGLVFVGIPTAGQLADRKVGARLAPDSRAYRNLRRLLRVAFTLNLMRYTGPMLWTISTNMGRKRAVGALVFALTILILLSAGDRLVQSDRLSFNSYDFFASSRAHGVNYQYYESQRDPGETYARVPSIQSDIIKDPYVKLFIPYIPLKHNAVIPRECPGVKPLQDRGVQLGSDVPVADSLALPVLACLTRMHAVSLDGAPLADPALSFYEHPGTGVKGVITYIPVDSLARGRHVIGVLPVPPVDLPTDSVKLARASWKKPMLIPFWR